MIERFAEAAARLDQGPGPSDGAIVQAIERHDARSAEEEQVWNALRSVIDPEIGLDIVTLGLVYRVECADEAVRVTFTLTTPGCPLADVIRAGIEGAAGSAVGDRAVHAALVWEPRWHPAMIQEDGW